MWPITLRSKFDDAIRTQARARIRGMVLLALLNGCTRRQSPASPPTDSDIDAAELRLDAALVVSSATRDGGADTPANPGAVMRTRELNGMVRAAPDTDAMVLLMGRDNEWLWESTDGIRFRLIQIEPDYSPAGS